MPLTLKLLCFWLLLAQTCYGQSTITGKIKTTDNQPLQYVNIYLRQNHGATTTNDQGYFELNFHPSEVVYDTLVISYVGLQTKIVPVNLSKKILNLNTIELKNGMNKLPQFSVVAPPPIKTILRRVRRRTNDNYPNSNEQLDGFYRETMYENYRCIEVNEAILKIDYSKYPMRYGLKRSFHSFWDNRATPKSLNDYGNVFFYSQFFPYFISPQDHVYISESRISSNHSKFGQEPSPYGGPTDLLALDKVKYQHDFLDKKIQSEYNFELQNYQLLNGILCYVIGFRPKEMEVTRVFHSYNSKMEYPIYAGQLFISVDDYAVLGFQAQRAVSADFSKYNSKDGFVSFPDVLKFSVNYSKGEDGKYRLSDLHVVQVVNKIVDKHTVRYKMKKDLYVSLNDTLTEQNANNEFDIGFLRSLRRFGNEYHAEAWAKYTSGKLFVPLDSNDLTQLQVKKSLQEQFLLQNISLESFEKPSLEEFIPKFENDTASYSDLKMRYDSILTDYVLEENAYYASVTAKLSRYKRSFTKQYFSVYAELESTDEKRVRYFEFDGHKILAKRDSTNHVLWVDFSTKDTLIDISELADGKPNFFVDNMKFQGEDFILGYEYKGRITKNLIVKSALFGMDSLTNCTEYFWLNDSSFAYVHTDDKGRPFQLIKRTYGNGTHEDLVIYSASDSLKEIALKRTTSGAYYVLSVEDNVESWVLIYTAVSLKLVAKTPTISKKEVQIDHYDNNRWVALTADLNSYNIYLLKTSDLAGIYTKKPLFSGKNYIDDFSLTKDYILFTEYQSGTFVLRTINLEDNTLKKLQIPEAFCSLTIDSTSCLSNTVHVYSESRIAPGCEYTVNLKTLEMDTIDFARVTEQFKTKNYQIEYREIKSEKMETGVPILIMGNKKSADAYRGMLVKTYGAYGSINFPTFNPEELILMNAGWLVVWVFPRGSLEKGKIGYLNGRGLKKQNTFDDVSACIARLSDKYSFEPYQVAAEGLSAGGLIMGVLANSDNSKIGALIFDRPFLNVLGNMMNYNLPLTNLEIGEWGNPQIEEEYNYILAYSPSQNIVVKDYPNMLFLGKYNDHITPYWDIAMAVASYRDAATNKPLILFNTDMVAGHKGNVNYIVEIDNMADKFAFLMYSLNAKRMTKPLK